MAAPNGQVGNCVKIVNNGPNTERYNIVILGDGFQAAQLPKYRTAVKALVQGIKGVAPFGDLWPGINFHRVDVSSTDAGATDPLPCGGTGAAPRTFFNASFCNNGIRRLLLIDTERALDVAYAKVPKTHFVLCLVNSTVFGGSGGDVATVSLAAGTLHTAIHEMGHTAFSLADEYEYYQGCASGETDRNHHVADEPAEPNVTTRIAGAPVKWAAQLTKAADGLPTTANAACAQCDTQVNPKPAGYVGAYEGAHYAHCGAYRPAFNCKMRTTRADFCGVCQQAIRDTIAPHLPAGGGTPTGPQIVAPVNPPPKR